MMNLSCYYLEFRLLASEDPNIAVGAQRVQKRSSAQEQIQQFWENKSNFLSTGPRGCPILDLTPEIHSNIILDLWQTSKIIGIDPVIASGGRFEGNCGVSARLAL